MFTVREAPVRSLGRPWYEHVPVDVLDELLVVPVFVLRVAPGPDLTVRVGVAAEVDDMVRHQDHAELQVAHGGFHDPAERCGSGAIQAELRIG